MRNLAPWLMALPLAARAVTPVEVLPAPTPRPGDTPLSIPVAPLDPVAPWMLTVCALGGVADPFVGKVALLAAARRSFGALGAELFAGRAVTWNAPALDVCRAPSVCRSPSDAELRAVTGRLDWMGGAWAVLRGSGGKLSPAGSATWPVTTEAGLGVAAVRYGWTNGADHHVTTAAARWGVAVGVEASRSIEVRAELGGLVYGARVRDVDTLERQLWLGTGLAWHPGGR